MTQTQLMVELWFHEAAERQRQDMNDVKCRFISDTDVKKRKKSTDQHRRSHEEVV